MPDPGEIRFACPACGAFNGVGADGCWSCHARFDPTGLGTAAPPSGPTGSPIHVIGDPDGPPTARPTSAGSFRIGPALVLIGLIAVGLGAMRADLAGGLFWTAMVVPAAIRTSLKSARRRAVWRPMGPGEVVSTFILTILGMWLIAFCCLLAFGITCYPAGVMTGNIAVAVAAGATAAIAAGIGATRALLRAGRGPTMNPRRRN